MLYDIHVYIPTRSLNFDFGSRDNVYTLVKNVPDNRQTNLITCTRVARWTDNFLWNWHTRPPTAKSNIQKRYRHVAERPPQFPRSVEHSLAISRSLLSYRSSPACARTRASFFSRERKLLKVKVRRYYTYGGCKVASSNILYCVIVSREFPNRRIITFLIEEIEDIKLSFWTFKLQFTSSTLVSSSHLLVRNMHVLSKTIINSILRN